MHDQTTSDPAVARPAPDFVEAGVALGYPRAAMEALRRQVLKAHQDIKDARVTPVGGLRRVQRLALAVSEAVSR